MPGGANNTDFGKYEDNMALKRRIKKLTKSMVAQMTGTMFLTCKECNESDVLAPCDTRSIICSDCVQKMIAPPSNYKKEKSDKPRGWHFMSYFEHGGIVYSKGIEVTDKIEIKRLKKEYSSVKTKTSVPVKTKKVTKQVKAVTSTVKKIVKKKVAKTTVLKRGVKNVRTTR